jgi:class 3 adenylate cyclase
MAQVPAIRDTLVTAGADPAIAAAIDRLIREGEDAELVRVDPLGFAAARGLDPDRTIEAFVHAAKIGVFEMVWDMLCAGCGAVLAETGTLRDITHASYGCNMCSLDNRPTLDDLVEVSFTVGRAVRAIGAHDPGAQPFWDYYRDHAFSRRLGLLVGTGANVTCLGSADVPAGGRARLAPADGVVAVFEPVTHGIARVQVDGEPTTAVQEATLIYTTGGVSPGVLELRPGPVAISLENRTNDRILVGTFPNPRGMELFMRRHDYLTAKRLFTNQVFRDQFRTGVMDLDQRLAITSLSVVFTDLKGSTELYERVGDLAAFDLVKQHFTVLADVIRARGGAIVKTIGDAVMATFPSPDRALAAALEIRTAMAAFNARTRHDDLIVKIGIHEGPCLAVTLNERIDYFGQTINVAARVQGLARDRAIFTTAPVIAAAPVQGVLAAAGLTPVAQKALLKGVSGEVTVYEIG